MPTNFFFSGAVEEERRKGSRMGEEIGSGVDCTFITKEWVSMVNLVHLDMEREWSLAIGCPGRLRESVLGC